MAQNDLGLRTEKMMTELVYCPMCTHTVEAAVILKGKRLVVSEGQKCGHCRSPLDAGYVVRRQRVA